MEVVKLKGRSQKVQCGDCVSVPDDYFGKPFQKTLAGLGFKDGRIYGRVVEVIEEAHHFSIRWDLDQQITYDHMLGTVQLEASNTPLQQPEVNSISPTVDPSADQQLEPSSSKTAVDTHAIIEEDLAEQIPMKHFLCVDGEYGEQVNVMKATMYWTNPGVLVHNVPLPKTHQKFRVDEVMQTDWEGFDEDRHGVGAFIVWNLDAISEVHETVKGTKKQERGKRFRKKLRKLAESDEEKEEEEEEKGEEDDEWDEKEEEEGEEGDECEEKEEEEGEEDDELEEEGIKKGKRKGRKKKVKRKGRNPGKKETQVSNKKKKKCRMDKEEEIEEKKEKTKSKRNKRRASRNNTQTEAKRMKVTIGKKAAEKKRSRNATKKQIIEKETELDYDESSEEDIEEGKKKKLLEEDKKIWTKGGWNVNPKERDTLRSKLIGEIGDLFEDDSLIDYFLMYLPIQYIKEEVIPATNAAAKLIDPDYEEFTFNEFIQILGIMYSMEVIRLPERRLYWSTTAEGLLPVFNFGRFVTLDRFEEFLNYWALSGDEDRNEQVLKFIDAVNAHLKNTLLR